MPYVSASTTPPPPATVGPPVDGSPSSCPLGEGSVLACIIVALVVAIVFLAALALSVLLLTCSQQPRRHHHRKRRRLHAARRREGESAFCGDQPGAARAAACSMRAEHGSSGRSSPDGSPYHPRYNSPASSACCENFRMHSCTCHGCSDRTPILHSTMCTQFHTAPTCRLMSRFCQEDATTPPSGDASATPRGSDHTVNAEGALSDSQSLEWDNFQPPLLATSTVSHLDITDEESLSVAAGGSQLEQRQPAQSQHWV